MWSYEYSKHAIERRSSRGGNNNCFLRWWIIAIRLKHYYFYTHVNAYQSCDLGWRWTRLRALVHASSDSNADALNWHCDRYRIALNTMQGCLHILLCRSNNFINVNKINAATLDHRLQFRNSTYNFHQINFTSSLQRLTYLVVSDHQLQIRYPMKKKILLRFSTKNLSLDLLFNTDSYKPVITGI